jgi:hypothetical protein
MGKFLSALLKLWYHRWGLLETENWCNCWHLRLRSDCVHDEPPVDCCDSEDVVEPRFGTRGSFIRGLGSLLFGSSNFRPASESGGPSRLRIRHRIAQTVSFEQVRPPKEPTLTVLFPTQSFQPLISPSHMRHAQANSSLRRRYLSAWLRLGRGSTRAVWSAKMQPQCVAACSIMTSLAHDTWSGLVDARSCEAIFVRVVSRKPGGARQRVSTARH